MANYSKVDDSGDLFCYIKGKDEFMCEVVPDKQLSFYHLKTCKDSINFSMERESLFRLGHWIIRKEKEYLKRKNKKK